MVSSAGGLYRQDPRNDNVAQFKTAQPVRHTRYQSVRKCKDRFCINMNAKRPLHSRTELFSYIVSPAVHPVLSYFHLLICLHVGLANPLVVLFWSLLCSAAAGGASACLYNYVDKNGQGQKAECEAPSVPHAGLKVTETLRVCCQLRMMYF